MSSRLGLASAGALSNRGLKVARLVQEPGDGLTEVLREMALQVRLLSATVDSLVRRPG
jgi:hypothetical protein